MHRLLTLICVLLAASAVEGQGVKVKPLTKASRSILSYKPYCHPSWPFCPFPWLECREGGWWCPYQHTCSACDYPEEHGKCCYPSCSSYGAYVGMPCRKRSSCYPCYKNSHRLCCKRRPTTLRECKRGCKSPYKACYLHGCPPGHRGWCCRWRACWGPWCAPCYGRSCKVPYLSSKANKYIAKAQKHAAGK